MNIILLSGGSGKRLWPLSNDVRSKQFVKLFDGTNGEKESMVQRMYRGIKEVNPSSKVVVATSKTQISEIHNQLGNSVSISLEPYRRDTFPAIALAVSFLHDVEGVDENDVAVVCPVDPYVDKEYFIALASLNLEAMKDNSNLVLMGMKPTYPSEKFGYIIPEEDKDVSKVKMFKEKPTEEVAKEYIAQGALWNSGIFAFKIKYLLKRAHELIDFTDYYDLFDKYEGLKKVSFDYAVSESEKSISVLKFEGKWEDLGTWGSLTKVMNQKAIGNVVLIGENNNTYCINELDIPLVCVGIDNAIVAASPEGILVSSLEESDKIKDAVSNLTNPVMFAEKSWGKYRVIDVSSKSIAIKVTLEAGSGMSYHSHQRRDEVWTIVSGKGTTTVDGIIQDVKPGDVIAINAGCKHTIRAITDLEIIEVQLGEDIDVKDKQKFELI